MMGSAGRQHFLEEYTEVVWEEKMFKALVEMVEGPR